MAKDGLTAAEIAEARQRIATLRRQREWALLVGLTAIVIGVSVVVLFLALR